MNRLAMAVVFSLAAVGVAAQTTAASDPTAIVLARKSVAALTAGAPISDVTIHATVTSVLGGDNETGTGILSAKGTDESRVDLSLSGGTLSEARNLVNRYPSGSWKKNSTAAAVPQHNCWTDAAWFFPALSSLGRTSTPGFLFSYVGLEQHGGITTEHIRVSRIGLGVAAVQRMSAMDFYLDPSSSLPMAISFQVHPDSDAGTDIPEEVRFANYQTVNGIRVPFHIQRMLNGGVILDIAVSNVTFNSSLADSLFSIQ